MKNPYPKVTIDYDTINQKVEESERKRQALLKMTQDCFDNQVRLGRETKKTKPT